MSKKRKIKEPYFDEREEEAVITYITTNSKFIKNEIYNEILREPFRKMTQSILRKYPIHIGNYEMELIEEEALTHLIEHMIKYRRYIIERYDNKKKKWIKLVNDEANNKIFRFIELEDAEKRLKELQKSEDNCIYKIFKSKAFSYCQTIVRNYYKDHSRKSYTEKKINLPYDDYASEIEENFLYEIEDSGEFYLEQLIDSVVIKMKEMIANNDSLKKKEIDVGEAIINVLENWHSLFMEETPEGQYNKKVSNKYAKNKVLFYLKEQTRLETKEIRMAIKPYKEIYLIEKMSAWEE